MTETIELKRIDKPVGNGPPKFDWKNEVQTHAQLMDKPLIPIKFLIDQVLVRPGLGVLGGKKKTGKSYLASDSAICVAQGKPFLGLHTSKAKVVYFALEDGERRTKQRLLQKKAPRDLDITYFYKWPALNGGLGRHQFIDMIQELKPGYIVIDTLASSKNKLVDENDNNAMADFINWIHGVALEYDLSILIVAHHGKVSTGEPGFDIRGASATPGATDVNMGLYKKEGFSDLVIEGRDIPNLELSIQWKDYIWQLKGNAYELRRNEAEDKILEAIMTLNIPCEVSQIAPLANMSRSVVQRHLERMRTEHIVEFETVLIKNVPHIKYYLKDITNTRTTEQPEHPNRLLVRAGLEHVAQAKNEAKTGVKEEPVRAVRGFLGLASNYQADSDEEYYQALMKSDYIGDEDQADE